MPANRNKKVEKAFHAKARNVWVRKPMTHVVENGKAYNRKKEKSRLRQSLCKGYDGVSFLYILKLKVGVDDLQKPALYWQAVSSGIGKS
jgi:hypothetical protein